MSAINPYSPPQADVADAGATQFSRPRVWAWRGRIGRLRFLAYSMGGYLLLFVAMAAGNISGSDAVRVVVTLAAFALYAVQYSLAVIQRSHDMGWSGWASLGMLVPVVNLVWIFNPGTKGSNRFGAPPPPNPPGVKVLALLMPAVMLVGILAAIALPAYQGYVLRAKQAQATAL